MKLTVLRVVVVSSLLHFALACGSSPEPAPPDPGAAGPYAVGHTSYVPTDSQRAGRPVAISVWYPAGTASSSPAQYPVDLFDTSRGASTSTMWESMGYDPVSEQPPPAKGGPFPLMIFSTGSGVPYWGYVFIGSRLASHGFVVAVTEHYGEGQLAWSPLVSLLHQMVNRVKDVPFATTAVLDRNSAPGAFLNGIIDPSKIAMAGHSLGGYAAYALSGGDDSLCDSRFPYTGWGEPWPYPSDTCVSAPADGRIRAIISLEGGSQLLRYAELARISVPSLIMGMPPGPEGSLIPRPHAAIGRSDSYRVDVYNSRHLSFSNWCDSIKILLTLGMYSESEATMWEQEYGCDVALPQAVMNQVTTKYMLAFLATQLGGSSDYRSILTPSYATSHEPPVRFYSSESCQANVPDSSYFTYSIGSGCQVEAKDPPGAFIP